MVILFALLFAPMMAGLDWVSTGRSNVGLQDASRYAMEQIRRDLGEAVYVYPATFIDMGSYRIIDYSQIWFNPPHRDATGKIASPTEGEYQMVSGVKYPMAVRFAVQLASQVTGPYSQNRTFALYRQQYVWSGTGWSLLSENALTPKTGATFTPTKTVCPVDQQTWDGYCPVCPNDPTHPISYVFSGVQFVPERVCSEELTTSNGVTYQAKHGAWDGASPSQLGSSFLPDNTPIYLSELDPRVALYQWDPSTRSYPALRAGMDSTTSAVRTERATWSSDAGTVTCGQAATDGPTGGPYKRLVFAGVGANGYYGVTTPPEIAPILPARAGPVDSANAPISYRIDPSQDGVLGLPAVIVPGSVKVRVVGVGTPSGGGTQRLSYDLRPTNNIDQGTMKGDQFCALLYQQPYTGGAGQPVGNCAEIRFSRFDPPRPTSTALFGGAPPAFSSFEIQIEYSYRHNYTYDAAAAAAGQQPFVNDLVRVDYSTRGIQNVMLALQRYQDLQPDATNTVYTAPTDEFPSEVRLREQVLVPSMGR